MRSEDFANSIVVVHDPKWPHEKDIEEAWTIVEFLKNNHIPFELRLNYPPLKPRTGEDHQES